MKTLLLLSLLQAAVSFTLLPPHHGSQNYPLITHHTFLNSITPPSKSSPTPQPPQAALEVPIQKRKKPNPPSQKFTSYSKRYHGPTSYLTLVQSLYDVNTVVHNDNGLSDEAWKKIFEDGATEKVEWEDVKGGVGWGRVESGSGSGRLRGGERDREKGNSVFGEEKRRRDAGLGLATAGGYGGVKEGESNKVKDRFLSSSSSRKRGDDDDDEDDEAETTAVDYEDADDADDADDEFTDNSNNDTNEISSPSLSSSQPPQIDTLTSSTPTTPPQTTTTTTADSKIRYNPRSHLRSTKTLPSIMSLISSAITKQKNELQNSLSPPSTSSHPTSSYPPGTVETSTGLLLPIYKDSDPLFPHHWIRATQASYLSGDYLTQSNHILKDDRTLRRNGIIKGTVVGYTEDAPPNALVDIGSKNFGILRLEEAGLLMNNINLQLDQNTYNPMFSGNNTLVFDVPDITTFVSVNSTYDFLVISDMDANGSFLLSRRRLEYRAAWSNIQELFKSDNEVFSGKIISVNRGGCICLVNGLRAFLPGSHLSGRIADNSLLGEFIDLKFLEVNIESNKIVVSNRRAVLQTQLGKLSRGTVVEGIVKAVKSYGLFVELNDSGLTALLHVSQISNSRVVNLQGMTSDGAGGMVEGGAGALFKVGDPIRALIVDCDKVNGRVALSTKVLESELGEMLNLDGRKRIFDGAVKRGVKWRTSNDVVVTVDIGSVNESLGGTNTGGEEEEKVEEFITGEEIKRLVSGSTSDEKSGGGVQVINPSSV